MNIKDNYKKMIEKERKFIRWRCWFMICLMLELGPIRWENFKKKFGINPEKEFADIITFYYKIID